MATTRWAQGTCASGKRHRLASYWWSCIFLKPFEGHNIAEFTLEPAGEGTEVTWAMHGPSPYISKLIGVFWSMDSLIGKDFEAGLASMKRAAEQCQLQLCSNQAP